MNAECFLKKRCLVLPLLTCSNIQQSFSRGSLVKHNLFTQHHIWFCVLAEFSKWLTIFFFYFLQGLNFQTANLSRLDLRYINFKYAILRNANLSGANLSYCNFERADLSGAVLDVSVHSVFIRQHINLFTNIL